MKLISWPGNKQRQMNQILRFVPDTIRDDAAVCEPFFGTGAFTMSLLDTTNGPVFAAEACKPLHNWWAHLMQSTNEMISLMSDYRSQYAGAKTDRKVFDELRDGWNAMNISSPSSVETAAMFWVLIYQSTNNLVRFNQSGKYNQTWGKGRNVPDPLQVFTEVPRRYISWLHEATNKGCFATDFNDAISKFIEYGDVGVCFIDPPYILETGTYDDDCWGDDELAQLMGWVERLENDRYWWMWTDYIANGDVRHPYENSIRSHFTVEPLVRNRNARPNGTSDTKEEVMILGSDVEYPENPQDVLFDYRQ
ncbi:MAG: DNA adenine methylase [Candidatus Methanomethylophilaceae archaeon]